MNTATAHCRFHASHRVVLPRRRRHSEIGCVRARPATVKQLIDALGIPHTEVTRVLTNEKVCDRGKMLRDGDKIIGDLATAMPTVRAEAASAIRQDVKTAGLAA